MPLDCAQWSIASYGGEVELNDIIGNGSWNIYAYGTEGNVSCLFAADAHRLDVASIDVGLTSWKPVKYENSMAQGMYLWQNGEFVNSSQHDGFAFELYNNQWDTN